MAKRLAAKIGTYEKDGQTKGRYANLGVVLSNDNGEYMLMDPTVSLAGILSLQNDMALRSGAQTRDRVMVSVFSDDGGQGSGGNSRGGYSGQQGGYGGQSGNAGGGAPAGDDDGLSDSDIPF